MNTPTGPVPQEPRHPEIAVCQHCRRELRITPASRRNRSLWLACIGMTALVVGGAAVLASEFLRERRKWLR